MDAILQQAAARFGIPLDTARSLAGGLFGSIKEKAAPEDFEAIAEKVPGVEDAIAASESPKPSGGGGGGLFGGGGGLGGLLGAASSALGAGNVGDLIGKFTQSGLDLGQAGSFAKMILDFARDKVGAETVDRVVSQVPGLNKLLG